MSFTYGFYNSLNHDRLYDAIQISSIFDGIILDGVFMSIGDRFTVSANGMDMLITVGTGRAWFDHTWNLNDAPYPLEVPEAELILKRIDAVVLEVNADVSSRENAIKIVKGTPSANPARPSMIRTETIHQYPLAFIDVDVGATSIRQSNITNMVGTSSTPYVTGVLEGMNIDEFVAKWEDQWNEFFETETNDILSTKNLWEEEWRNWYEAQTNEVQDFYEAWIQEWNLWSSTYKQLMEDTASDWNRLWNAWFYEYINQNQAAVSNWQKEKENEFQEWFDGIRDILDGDVAGNLSGAIVDLQDRVGVLELFKDNLVSEHAVYDHLMDRSWTRYDNVLDYQRSNVLDSNTLEILGKQLETDAILDSNGQPIDGTVIFVVK